MRVSELVSFLAVALCMRWLVSAAVSPENRLSAPSRLRFGSDL